MLAYVQILISDAHGRNKKRWIWPGARFMKIPSVRKYIVGDMGPENGS